MSDLTLRQAFERSIKAVVTGVDWSHALWGVEDAVMSALKDCGLPLDVTAADVAAGLALLQAIDGKKRATTDETGSADVFFVEGYNAAIDELRAVREASRTPNPEVVVRPGAFGMGLSAHGGPDPLEAQ